MRTESTLKKQKCVCLFSAVIWAIYTRHVFERVEPLNSSCLHANSPSVCFLIYMRPEVQNRINEALLFFLLL